MVRVLLVDEQPLFRDGVKRLLQSDFKDIQVVGEAMDGVNAISKALEVKPDVVLTDIVTKKGDGIEVIEKICAQLPNTKVIVLSVSDDPQDLFQSVLAGASAYLLKTCSITQLVDCIRAVSEGDSFLTPTMVAKLMEEFRRQVKGGNKQEMYSLSLREREILALAAKGATNKEIAQKCYISETTVKAHFRNILGKMDVKNRASAVALATTKGILKKLLGAEEVIPK